MVVGTFEFALKEHFLHDDENLLSLVLGLFPAGPQFHAKITSQTNLINQIFFQANPGVVAKRGVRKSQWVALKVG